MLGTPNNFLTHFCCRRWRGAATSWSGWTWRSASSSRTPPCPSWRPTAPVWTPSLSPTASSSPTRGSATWAPRPVPASHSPSQARPLECSQLSAVVFLLLCMGAFPRRAVSWLADRCTGISCRHGFVSCRHRAVAFRQSCIFPYMAVSADIPVA